MSPTGSKHQHLSRIIDAVLTCVVKIVALVGVATKRKGEVVVGLSDTVSRHAENVKFVNLGFIVLTHISLVNY